MKSLMKSLVVFLASRFILDWGTTTRLIQALKLKGA